MLDAHSHRADDMPPVILGPYSPAVKTGDLIFVSGQSGVDPMVGRVPDDIESECRQAFRNLSKVLVSNGAELGNVVKTTLLYTDLENLEIINSIYAEVFPGPPPARTAAIVKLAGGRHIAIDAIASLKHSTRAVRP